MSKLPERDLILREAAKIADALAETFAPICEVVVHDLTNPSHAIVKIENNISGRSVGDPATELGLTRIAKPDFPDKLVNYANRLSDGRVVKSTSIGLRDGANRYVAAICLNVDVSYLNGMADYIRNLTAIKDVEGVSERIQAPRSDDIVKFIRDYALARNKDPKSLNTAEKRDLMAGLQERGLMSLKGSIDEVSKVLGTSRSSIYYYVK
ncbi:helix-turn-helix transcriptional regulator [Nitratireductor pacificus]|uniref:helix-turn-helix transcriptional regulator n=1 Tax=Nitratireductor pacificus TaxID=1231180 RepID=UPI0002F70459|nr:PAS domain-containing protein [Nitratireductor pacificus]